MRETALDPDPGDALKGAESVLIDGWHERSRQVQDAHYEAGLLYERLFLALGIPVIALSALTGGSEVLNIIEKNIAGVISLCIAVLAGLQTFLKFSQRSERHRMAGARYGAIRRELEVTKSDLAESNGSVKEEIRKIERKLDTLAAECPEIPQHILAKYRPGIRDR